MDDDDVVGSDGDGVSCGGNGSRPAVSEPDRRTLGRLRKRLDDKDAALRNAIYAVLIATLTTLATVIPQLATEMLRWYFPNTTLVQRARQPTPE